MLLSQSRMALLGWAAAAIPVLCHAEDFPTRPIKVIVPYAAGGGGDVAMRVVTEALAKQLGQGVVIDNKPGPNGIAAAQAAKAAEPDGYSMIALGNIYAIGRTLMEAPPFDVINDFIPIAIVAHSDVVAYTSPKSPIRNLQDVIDRAKTTSSSFNIGSGIVGTTHFLTAELFKSTAKIDVPVVSYRSPGELSVAVTAGEASVGFDLIPPILGLLESGALKPLAVSSNARFPRLPQTPTFKESGVFTSVTGWAIFAAPARTPQPIVERLNKELAAVLGDREVQKKFEQMGYTLGGGTPQDAKQLLVSEVDR